MSHVVGCDATMKSYVLIFKNVRNQYLVLLNMRMVKQSLLCCVLNITWVRWYSGMRLISYSPTNVPMTLMHNVIS